MISNKYICRLQVLGIIFSIFFTIILTFISVYCIRPAIAIKTNDTTSYKSTGELLKDSTNATTTQPFNTTNLTAMVNMLSGASGNINTQIKNLTTTAKTTPLTATTIRAKTYNKNAEQSVVVRLGGLDWLVAYVSTSKTGDLIATLWLTNNYQSKWANQTTDLGEYFGLVNGGLYSDMSADWSSNSDGLYPSNMYGTSYMRVVTLNNPQNRQYSTNLNTLSTASAQNTSNPFALYTMSQYGLTDYLTTPSNMSWQADYIQHRNLIGNKPNDASNTSLSHNAKPGYTVSFSSSEYNYINKSGYTNWGKDYVWIPSMAETGVINAGLWDLNNAERSFYDGSTKKVTASKSIGSKNNNGDPTSANVYYWSRSAYPNNHTSCSSVFPEGNDYYVDGNPFFTYHSLAVRPAIHFNLTKAVYATAGEFNISVTNYSDGGYLDSTGNSYNSAYPTSKSKLIVQIYTLNGDFVSASTLNVLNEDIVNIAPSLHIDTFYRIKIIAPTYMRYSIYHYIDNDADCSNYFNTSSFTIYNSGKQSISIDFQAVQDDSWNTNFTSP